MKRKLLSGLIAAGLLFGGMTKATFAGNGPGNGRGYGGPPKSDDERAARQAACNEQNGGVYPNGGPKAAGQCNGQRQGNGKGQGARHGLRDGTGMGNCPVNSSAPTQKRSTHEGSAGW